MSFDTLTTPPLRHPSLVRSSIMIFGFRFSQLCGFGATPYGVATPPLPRSQEDYESFT